MSLRPELELAFGGFGGFLLIIVFHLPGLLGFHLSWRVANRNQISTQFYQCVDRSQSKPVTSCLVNPDALCSLWDMYILDHLWDLRDELGEVTGCPASESRNETMRRPFRRVKCHLSSPLGRSPLSPHCPRMITSASTVWESLLD